MVGWSAMILGTPCAIGMCIGMGIMILQNMTQLGKAGYGTLKMASVIGVMGGGTACFKSHARCAHVRGHKTTTEQSPVPAQCLPSSAEAEGKADLGILRSLWVG